MAVLGELFPLLIRLDRVASVSHEKFSNGQALGFVLVGIPVYYMTQRHEDTDSSRIAGERHYQFPQVTADHAEHKISPYFLLPAAARTYFCSDVHELLRKTTWQAGAWDGLASSSDGR